MTDSLPAVVALAVGLTMAAGIWWASRHNARQRTDRDRRLQLAIEDEASDAWLDELVDLDWYTGDGPDSRHVACEFAWGRGHRDQVCRRCLASLEAEATR